MGSYWEHARGTVTVLLGRYPTGHRHDDAIMFRIARPNTEDAVSPHVDKNFGGIAGSAESKGGNPILLTVWIPLIGFDSRYTLSSSPGSHNEIFTDDMFDQQDETRVTYEFKPEVFDGREFVRPEMKLGQAIILHPNIIHGASVNKGDVSRVSVELRIINSDFVNDVFEQFSVQPPQG
jgi:ectoine hydroxylase-related dioxygenase (phytanoyl-CoA dioxygenase family)